MYNTKYQCRYNNDDVFLETDMVTNDEKEYVRNILYKEDLINIFEIDCSDDFNIFNHIISTLYSKIRNCQPLVECMIKVSKELLIEDHEFGLCILYSYDYMYLTHICISEYLDTGKISEENKELLYKCINN